MSEAENDHAPYCPTHASGDETQCSCASSAVPRVVGPPRGAAAPPKTAKAPKAEGVPATSADVYAALRRRYPVERGEWGLVFEVGDATGFSVKRHADAVAMSLWPSRGLGLHGIEVKASRGDWLREKADPAKAEPVSKFCDYWWLAVASDDVVKDGELPDTWGLMVLRGTRLVAVREAPKRTPVPLTAKFVAAIVRASQRQTTDEEIRAAVKAAERKVKTELESRDREAAQRAETALAQLRAQHKALSDAVWRLEREAGISVHGDTSAIVAKIRRAEAFDEKSSIERLRHVQAALRDQAASIDRLLATHATPDAPEGSGR